MVGSTMLTVYLGAVNGLLYVATDQYIPSLPRMEVELSGSETILSGSVQLNLLPKAFVSLLVAPLSDQIGRKPILLTCAILMILGSFGCALAPNVYWFISARIIQSLGESLEPLTSAIVRDCYPDPGERLAALSVVGGMLMLGTAVGPVLGGLVASVCHWRVPFFVLSLAWAGLAHYAAIYIRETGIDVKSPSSYWHSVKRVFCNQQLLMLLLAESCIQCGYFTFNANASYLTEAVYGKSTAATSVLMGIFVLCSAIGLMMIMSSTQPVLSTAKIWMTAYSLGAGLLLVIAAFCSDRLWVYLGSSFLMGFLLPCYVPLTVLYLDPVEDIAGTAASFEIFFQSGPSAVYSGLATQGLIGDGQRGLTWFQAGSTVLAGAVFWLGYGSTAKEPDSERVFEDELDKST
ncbi:unnamed protein product [Durusdinium trenchii]|uniref:Major facilitator superfamily (MFS) profile domain-containing protein n=1 Tax=Durusdinium trenchii TaxID=1381693 RepID=A0ABP0K6C6_9DINO